jgi:hypothetical protein
VDLFRELEGSGSLISGSAEAEKLRRELQDLKAQQSASAVSAQQMSTVIETAKRKVDKQQAKLKSITARSQKRCAANVSAESYMCWSCVDVYCTSCNASLAELSVAKVLRC